MKGYIITLKILEQKRKDGYHVNKEILRAGVNLFRFGLYAKDNLKEELKEIPFRVKIQTFIPGVLLHYIDILFPTFVNKMVLYFRNK